MFWSIVTVAKELMENGEREQIICHQELIFPGEVKVTRKMETWEASLDKLTKNTGWTE